MRLNYQYQLIRAIRKFFDQQDFVDVMTPPLVQNPGMEVHIHPFRAYSPYKKEMTDLYLHTSPEFCMKELLACPEEKLDKIFTLTYSFRDEPSSPIHRSQFIMLEWYRKNENYLKIMQDAKELIDFTYKYFEDKKIPSLNLSLKKNWEEFTIQEIILRYSDIDILEFLNKKDLKKILQEKYPGVPLPRSNCDWDDYFFLFFLNEIEPHFINHPKLILKEFPAPLCALSTLKKSDPRVCERFEIYLNGVEICNCFNELTDLPEQKKRFKDQAQDKKRIYDYELNEPLEFYQALEKGLPKCSGIALGVERLLCQIKNDLNPFYH